MKLSFRTLLRCNLLKALLLLLLLWLLAGCAGPLTGQLPPGSALDAIAAAEPGTPFAVAPDGERLALVRDGLRLRDPASGETLLAPEPPAALAWSPDGERLAAAFPGGEGSRLRIYAGARLEREAEVAGRVGRLLWHPDGDLLTVATTLEVFSFGAGHRTVLLRWGGEGDPGSVPLHDVTLKPRTVLLWGEALYRMAHPALSPDGDELLYARLHDPPEFDPYLKLVLRNLGTGNEREVARVPLSSGGARFVPGEAVLYGDGAGRTARLDPWTGAESAAWDLPGRALALSPGGRYLLLDGRLHRDGAEIAVLAAGEGQFAAGALYFRDGRRLYRLSGLSEELPAPPPAAVRDELRRLRRWRSGGLIDHDDYLQQKERLFER